MPQQNNNIVKARGLLLRLKTSQIQIFHVYNLCYEIGIGEVAPGISPSVAFGRWNVDRLPLLSLLSILTSAHLLTHQGQTFLFHPNPFTQTSPGPGVTPGVKCVNTDFFLLSTCSSAGEQSHLFPPHSPPPKAPL